VCSTRLGGDGSEDRFWPELDGDDGVEAGDVGEIEAGVVRSDELFCPVTGEVRGDTRGLRRPMPDVIGNGAGTNISTDDVGAGGGGEGGGEGEADRSVFFDCSGCCSGNEGSLGQAPREVFSPPEFNSNRNSDERPPKDVLLSNPRDLREPAKELFDAR